SPPEAEAGVGLTIRSAKPGRQAEQAPVQARDLKESRRSLLPQFEAERRPRSRNSAGEHPLDRDPEDGEVHRLCQSGADVRPRRTLVGQFTEESREHDDRVAAGPRQKLPAGQPRHPEVDEIRCGASSLMASRASTPAWAVTSE